MVGRGKGLLYCGALGEKAMRRWRFLPAVAAHAQARLTSDTRPHIAGRSATGETSARRRGLPPAGVGRV